MNLYIFHRNEDEHQIADITVKEVVLAVSATELLIMQTALRAFALSKDVNWIDKDVANRMLRNIRSALNEANRP